MSIKRRMLPVKDLFPAGPLPTQPARTWTIMTYNLLAQCLVRRELFPYAKKEDLKVKTRYPMLIDEITRVHKPDIACLQEVDCLEELKPHLADAGYDHVFLKRNMEKEGGHGLCIIWKSAMFKKIDYRPLVYDESPLTHPTPINPFTGNVAQLLALGVVQPHTARCSLGVIVTNTHLFWRPEANYERLRQSYVLMSAAAEFKRAILSGSSEFHDSTEIKDEWPIFLCGDFNACPNDAVYPVLLHAPMTPEQEQMIQPVQRPPRDGDPPAPESGDSGARPLESLDNPLPAAQLVAKIQSFPPFVSMTQTYRDADPNHSINPGWQGAERWGGEPTFTCFAVWKGTLDYIFWWDFAVSDKPQVPVNVLKVLELPKVEELVPGLPNKNFASDHLAVMVEIALYA
ncbi:Endonuclease/exonuclease/phosphatase [Polychytrium aggregatum]|uniref:Endonuclease/exonuclease/phosphatase n=1 Tax=Polychytrium aggregatum TaxID=110093 RepID=UPI0022FF0CAB|nr:Endonuclease/exonuclease/phosphatase [Polychytrium aggregatum]KAI9202058.1 Endonuclease/exonuclease/phosphatase [Polychytrium aggregatum]